MRRLLAAVLAVLLASITVVAAAHERGCSAADAAAADAIVDGLDNWEKLQGAMKKYGHCDSGSIAEGNSEAVARLLVDQWSSLPTLVQLTRTDPRLRRFVLKHVDSTLDSSDLERIGWLSSNSCPAGAAAFCTELRAAASNALNPGSRRR